MIGGRSASTCAKFGVAVLKASASACNWWGVFRSAVLVGGRSGKFGIAVLKASMIDLGVHQQVHVQSLV